MIKIAKLILLCCVCVITLMSGAYAYTGYQYNSIDLVNEEGIVTNLNNSFNVPAVVYDTVNDIRGTAWLPADWTSAEVMDLNGVFNYCTSVPTVSYLYYYEIEFKNFTNTPYRNFSVYFDPEDPNPDVRNCLIKYVPDSEIKIGTITDTSQPVNSYSNQLQLKINGPIFGNYEYNINIDGNAIVGTAYISGTATTPEFKNIPVTITQGTQHTVKSQVRGMQQGCEWSRYSKEITCSIPSGTVTVNSEVTSYCRQTITLEPGLPIINVKQVRISGDSVEPIVFSAPTIPNPCSVNVDFIDKNRNSLYDIIVVFTDKKDYQSEQVLHIPVPQAQCTVTDTIESYNKRTIILSPGINESGVDHALITGDVIDGSLAIYPPFNEPGEINLVDNDSDGIYTFDVFFIDTAGYLSNSIRNTIPIPRAQCTMPGAVQSYNKRTVILSPGINESGVQYISITGDVNNGSLIINSPFETPLDQPREINLVDNDSDGNYTFTVQFVDMDGGTSNRVEQSTPVPHDDFNFEGTKQDDEGSYTYGLIGRLLLDPGIQKESVKSVHISGAIEGISKGGWLVYPYSSIEDDRIQIQMKPDSQGLCEIFVQYEDMSGDLSQQLMRAIRVKKAPASITIQKNNSFTHLILQFTADNYPTKMKITGDITDSFRDQYIDYTDIIDVHVTPFAGEKILGVDFWNNNDNSHSSASTIYQLSTRGVLTLTANRASEEAREFILNIQSQIPLQELEISGDITSPVLNQWMPFAEEIPIVLTAEQGKKYLYARAKDSTGFITDYENIELALIIDAYRIECQRNVVDLKAHKSAQYTIYIDEPCDVEVKVYEITGELIKTAYEGFHQGGILPVSWSGVNESGKEVGQGIYLMVFKTESSKEIKKIVVQR